MTPQSHLMLVAPLAAGRAAALNDLLATMNSSPGAVDPHNSVVPFARLERLHFARFAILDDGHIGDLAVYGVPVPDIPTCLAFIADCDGPLAAFLADLVSTAGPGLRKIFAHCQGYDEHGDLAAWMLAHHRPLAASYVNWIGRTVRQVHEESALQRALAAKVPRERALSGADAQRVRRELSAFVQEEIRAQRLALTPDEPTPLSWQIANLAHLILVPFAGLVALPFLIALSPLLIYMLRSREKSDPENEMRVDPAAVKVLQSLEDHDVTNQFTAIGAVKPGLFRRWTLSAALLLLDYACRHIYKRGYLTRVQTIHFARWVFLDDKSRLLFASNYDGSLESYMDDFINKVAWGLNLVFSNGAGYPKTDWLLLRGARREQRFKNYLRRHELPTQVWYKAYPGLTVINVVRNQRIRAGLESASMTDAQALAWLRML